MGGWKTFLFFGVGLENFGSDLRIRLVGEVKNGRMKN